MSYPRIEAYIQREHYEGYTVLLVVKPDGDGYQARLEDQGKLLLDIHGEKSMCGRGDTVYQALDALEELAG